MTSEQKKKLFAKSKTTLFHEPNVSRAYFPLARGKPSNLYTYIRRDKSDERSPPPRPQKQNSLVYQNYIVSKRNARLSLANDGFSRSFDDAWQDYSRKTDELGEDLSRMGLDNRDGRRNRYESCSTAEDLNETPQQSGNKRSKKTNRLFNFHKIFSSKSSSIDDQLTPPEVPSSPVSSSYPSSRVKSSKSVTFSDADEFTEEDVSA